MSGDAGRQLRGARERRQRFGVAAEMAQRPAEIEQGGRDDRAPSRTASPNARAASSSRPGLGQADAEIVVDRRQIGADQAGLDQRLDRAVPVAGGAAGIAEIVPDLPVAGVRGDDLLVAGDRLGVPPLRLQGIAFAPQVHHIS